MERTQSVHVAFACCFDLLRPNQQFFSHVGTGLPVTFTSSYDLEAGKVSETIAISNASGR